MTDLTPIDKTTAVSANPTNLTKPLTLRLRTWGIGKTENAIQGKDVSPRQALREFRDDEPHYLSPVTGLYAAKVWRELAANIGSRNMPAAEQAHVIQAFAVDCIEEGWSEYTLSRAAIAWRRSAERFMPTFGQLRACVQSAGQKGGPSHYREMLEMLERRAGLSKPKDEAPQGMTIDELRPRIAAMRQERKNGFKIVRNKRRDWTIIDQKLLEGLETKLSNLEATA